MQWVAVHYIQINSSISFYTAHCIHRFCYHNKLYEHLRNIIPRLSFLFLPLFLIIRGVRIDSQKGLVEDYMARYHHQYREVVNFSFLYYLLVKSFQLIKVPTPVKVS